MSTVPRVDLDAFNDVAATSNGTVEEAVFVDAYDFIASKTEQPTPLWGDDQMAAIPAGGLAVLAGRPGAGKTTFVLDLACHLAAGHPYPAIDPANERAPKPLAVGRPLRVALIENEGPQEMFRTKLEEKLRVFPHTIGRADDINTGCLVVQTWRWGAFSFADKDAHLRSIVELDAYAIDLVIGDPLASLGPEGVGSPSDTRDFVRLLRPLGLGTHRAFLFLHHFRERAERTEDELARVSGAWGGHLDTLITLSSAASDDQARLAWPKLRWSKVRKPAPLILGRIWTTAGFEAIGEEGDTALIEPLIYAELARMRATKGGRGGQGWATTTELAKSLVHKRVHVTKALEGAPHLFTMVTGEAAKALGARSIAKLWGLSEWVETDTEPPTQFLSGQDGTTSKTRAEAVPDGHSRSLLDSCPPSIEGTRTGDGYRDDQPVPDNNLPRDPRADWLDE